MGLHRAGEEEGCIREGILGMSTALLLIPVNVVISVLVLRYDPKSHIDFTRFMLISVPICFVVNLTFHVAAALWK